MDMIQLAGKTVWLDFMLAKQTRTLSYINYLLAELSAAEGFHTAIFFLNNSLSRKKICILSRSLLNLTSGQISPLGESTVEGEMKTQQPPAPPPRTQALTYSFSRLDLQ